MLQACVLATISAILALVGIRKYQEYKWGHCNNKTELTSKIVIVTGANSGIGYEVAKNLAARKAQVIVTCKNLDTAIQTMYDIKNKLKDSSVVPMELNLGSIKSISNFVDKIKSTYSEVHILVNNAGVSFPKNVKYKTEDGFEIHFGINYLGHFLLTNMLQGLLKKSKSSRVIMVSSLLHEKGTLYIEDLNLENIKDADAYANSKLAVMYFCYELNKRLKDTEVKVFSVCPGWVYTNLFRHHNIKWYKWILLSPIAFLFMRTPKQGAQTILYCATERDLPSGCMYRNCKKYKSKVQIDDDISSKLWNITEDMIQNCVKSKFAST